MREYSNSICGNESNDSDSSLDITDITIIAGVFFDGTNNNKYNETSAKVFLHLKATIDNQ